MKLTRQKLESQGLSLRTPPGKRILEVPADFGWDDQGIAERAEVLRLFGFNSERKIETKQETTYQISQ